MFGPYERFVEFPASLLMRTPVFRTICAVLLISFGMMFSGVVLIASAELPVAIEAANKNHCNPDGAQSCPLPCTTPICPLCICVIAEAVLAFVMKTNIRVIDFDFSDVAWRIPDPYVNEIFHPPRAENEFLTFVRQAV